MVVVFNSTLRTKSIDPAKCFVFCIVFDALTDHNRKKAQVHCFLWFKTEEYTRHSDPVFNVSSNTGSQ